MRKFLSRNYFCYAHNLREEMFFNRQRTQTSFIQLDTQKCKACWKCIKSCANKVIGRINLPGHKHAFIIEPDACTGCLNCLNTCQYEAYSMYNAAHQETEKLKKRTLNNFLVNNLLLFFGLVMIISGLVLQMGFHMGGHERNQIDTHNIQSQSIQYEELREINVNRTVLGFNYPAWSDIHKYVIVFILLLMIYHTYIHWKWYKGIFTKHLIGKNKQVIILSVLFLLVAVTGFVPWFIDLSGGDSIFRMLFIEIHDKLSLVLIVFLIMHFVGRIEWFSHTYAKLKR